MLTELRIRNLAVIDDVSIRPGPGLTVITGETGAGKSMLVGALSLLLGERASDETVRAGSDRASVVAAFDLSGREDLVRALDERGIESDEGALVLKREIAVGGRNRAWINGAPTTAAMVGEVGRLLIDLHGQHEHQTLLARTEQRAILDLYGGHLPLCRAVEEAHARHREAIEALEGLLARQSEARERLDLLRFQAGEIEEAKPEADEEERLEAEASRLAHSEELATLSGGLANALTGGMEGDAGATSMLGGLRRDLERLVSLDGAQQELLELLDTAFYAAEELGERLEAYGEGIEHDPARLEEIRRRQELLFRLKRKYGPELDDVIRHGEKVREELDALDRADFEIAAAERARETTGEALRAAAAELSAARAAAADTLGTEVQGVLPDLGMPEGRFEATLLAQEGDPGPHGAEQVEFRVSLNRGFDPRPLRKVASGGELSRVMLALKTILARLDAVPTLVFDEVDAGIGGEVARQVGATMHRVAGAHQVFAVSHLPQIAARADAHWHVRKGQRDGRAATEIEHVEGDARVQELARMLGGDAESEASLSHAREMLSVD